MLLDPTRATPCGHVAAQLVRFARRVVRGDDRQLHHLLLEQRHAERLGEHGLEALVRIGHGLEAAAPAKIRMHHTAGDRARPDERDFDDEVIEVARTQARQHRHLRARFDLERADGVGGADHVVRGLVLGGDGRHRQIDAAVLAQQIEAEV